MAERPVSLVYILIMQLPYRLRTRFESLSHYVAEIVRDALRQEGEIAAQKRPKRLRPEQMERIQLIVFTYALDQLFREGTRAAIFAVDRFKELGQRGFQIGKTEFVGRNQNVLRGANLSRLLRESIGSRRLISLLDSAQGIQQLTLRALREVANGQPLD